MLNTDYIDLDHPSDLKDELKEKLGRMYDVKDQNAIFVFKFITHFGRGKSIGFGLIYDSVENAKKYEPKYRLIRVRFLSYWLYIECQRGKHKRKLGVSMKIIGLKYIFGLVKLGD
ncbi:hypothetical protein ACOSP7_017362 [Xanthoceras sorbifolium]